MTALNTSTATASDRELVITRIFDAPREIVFDAWSKAEHLVHWFGPTDFTLPSCTLDFRVGGSYRFCMRSPDGEDHWVWGEYREIDPPERIVMTWNREDVTGKIWSRTLAEFTFIELDNKTSFTLKQGLFETGPFCEEHGFGWGQALDRLGEYVAAL
jgi:uncharacterized protein YndB with AHSA1/START domain